jgi:hypothetical protein
MLTKLVQGSSVITCYIFAAVTTPIYYSTQLQRELHDYANCTDNVMMLQIKGVK